MDPGIRTVSLTTALAELLAMPPVEGAIVLTSKGRILAGRAPPGADPAALARECRTLLAAGSAAVPPRDDVVRVDLRGTRGSTIVMRVGDDLILAVVAATKTPETLSLELSRAADAIDRISG